MLKHHTNSHSEDPFTGYSASHLHKGGDYDGRFSSLPGRRLMWEQEKQLLHTLVSPLSKANYLDFASGTGRILAHIAPAFQNAFALDISAQMLSVAKEKCPEAQFVQANFRDDPAALRNIRFDLITAFRFFPNAEDALRRDAMGYIARHLADNGRFIVNNHRSYNSLPYRTLRFLGRSAYKRAMHHQEMLQLAEAHSLQLVQCYSLGIVPQTERRAILPWGWVSRIENRNYQSWATRHRLGYNIVYVFALNSAP